MSLTLPVQVFRLAANHPATNSVVLATLSGLVIPVKTGQRIFWELYALFTLGATGGFRFQPTAPAGITGINSQWAASEGTTPADFSLEATTQTPFTNAAAVAATYQVNGQGSFVVGATEGNFEMQFAQNNATGNAGTVLAGAIFRVTLF